MNTKNKIKRKWVMLEKKGYTLIELLSVIVILSILMMIAVPAVTKILEKVRENMRIQTAEKYIDASNQYYISESAIGSNEFNGKTNIINSLEIEGKQADSGYIFIDSNGVIKIALKIEKKCYKNKGKEVFLDAKSEYCDILEDTTHDKTPGILDGKGTEKEPYKIESVEDFVKFANIINNKEYKTNGYRTTTYKNKKVNYNFYTTLTNNLDFKAEQSYANPYNVEFGDINKNGIVEPLIKEINSDSGFPMIDVQGNEDFKLFFDGKNHYIKNYNCNIKNTDPSKTITISLFGNYDGSFNSTHINNLILKDIDLKIDTAGNANISGLIQQIRSYYSNQLSDITITGKINAKCGGTCNVGGMATSIFTYSGSNKGAKDEVNGINVNLDIDIESQNAVVGGITARASNYGYYISDSSFKGNIKVKALNEALVGGINGSALYFRSVNTSVISNINVEAQKGEAYGIGKGTIHNSFYKGNINIKSYYPITLSCLGSNNVYNSYAIGNIIVDATRRDQWPKIAGLSTNGNVYNSYHIGNLDYKTITSYGGGGPTVLGSLLSGSGNATNSFVRGKITNLQGTTWNTYFGFLSTHKKDSNEPTITNSYYSEDSSYVGNAPCYYGGSQVSVNNLKKADWYKKELKLDNNWTVKDKYYPLINKCNYDPTTETCNATNDLLPNQTKVIID